MQVGSVCLGSGGSACCPSLLSSLLAARAAITDSVVISFLLDSFDSNQVVFSAGSSGLLELVKLGTMPTFAYDFTSVVYQLTWILPTEIKDG